MPDAAEVATHISSAAIEASNAGNQWPIITIAFLVAFGVLVFVGDKAWWHKERKKNGGGPFGEFERKLETVRAEVTDAVNDHASADAVDHNRIAMALEHSVEALRAHTESVRELAKEIRESRKETIEQLVEIRIGMAEAKNKAI